METRRLPCHGHPVSVSVSRAFVLCVAADAVTQLAASIYSELIEIFENFKTWAMDPLNYVEFLTLLMVAIAFLLREVDNFSHGLAWAAPSEVTTNTTMGRLDGMLYDLGHDLRLDWGGDLGADEILDGLKRSAAALLQWAWAHLARFEEQTLIGFSLPILWLVPLLRLLLLSPFLAPLTLMFFMMLRDLAEQGILFILISFSFTSGVFFFIRDVPDPQISTGTTEAVAEVVAEVARRTLRGGSRPFGNDGGALMPGNDDCAGILGPHRFVGLWWAMFQTPIEGAGADLSCFESSQYLASAQFIVTVYQVLVVIVLLNMLIESPSHRATPPLPHPPPHRMHVTAARPTCRRVRMPYSTPRSARHSHQPLT